MDFMYLYSKYKEIYYVGLLLCFNLTSVWWYSIMAYSLIYILKPLEWPFWGPPQREGVYVLLKSIQTYLWRIMQKRILWFSEIKIFHCFWHAVKSFEIRYSDNSKKYMKMNGVFCSKLISNIYLNSTIFSAKLKFPCHKSFSFR